MHECHQAYKRGSDLANIELFLDDAEMQVETNEKLTFFTSRWRRYEIARLRALPGGYN